MAFNWTCPHCSVTQTVVDEKRSSVTRHIGLKDQSEGNLGLRHLAIGCSNPECLRSTIKITVGEVQLNSSSYYLSRGGNVVFDQFIYPQGFAKPQPEYIPKAIREDYHEACLIRDLSPKASATLVRRCIQGMIRNFAGISKGRLIDEIDALRKAVVDGSADRSISIESVEAIDRVRGIENIGAHMEKDINQIVEVDPGEAQALIELVEMLFDEWYAAREKRTARLAHIESIADAKAATKKLLAAPPVQNALAQAATAADLLGAGPKE